MRQQPFTPADIPGLALWRQDLPPEAQAYLEYRLKEQVEEDAKAPEPWKPEDGEMFFFVNDAGGVDGYKFCSTSGFDVEYVTAGNCYRTREEAEKAAERVRKAYRG